MEYSAEEDISIAISVQIVNVTLEQHEKVVICQVYHVSWPNPATVSASFNVLCEYDCINGRLSSAKSDKQIN